MFVGLSLAKRASIFGASFCVGVTSTVHEFKSPLAIPVSSLVSTNIQILNSGSKTRESVSCESQEKSRAGCNGVAEAPFGSLHYVELEQQNASRMVRSRCQQLKDAVFSQWFFRGVT